MSILLLLSNHSKQKLFTLELSRQRLGKKAELLGTRFAQRESLSGKNNWQLPDPKTQNKDLRHGNRKF